MTDKEIYDEIYRKIMNVQTNLVNAMNCLGSFASRIDNSLVVNNIPLYKQNSNNVKEELNDKYLKIKNEIIPEVQGKML